MASFGGNREENFSLANGGSLLVELNIEGGSNGGASGVGGQGVVTDSPDHQVSPRCLICRKTRKTGDVDLDEVPSDDVDVAAEYCTCDETPRVIMQGGTGSGGGQVAVVGNNARNGGGGSRRARMRQTPRRFQNGVGSDSGSGSGSSNGIPTYEEVAPVTIVSNATISRLAGSIGAGARPFRIRDIVSRQDTMLRSFGSGVEVNDSHALTVGQTSRDGLINHAQILGSLMDFNLQSLRNLVPNAMRVEYDGSTFRVRINGQEILHENNLNQFWQIAEEINSLLAFQIDVDEMIYEDIFPLEERIEAVNTGMTEEVITQCLRRGYYRAPENRPPEEAESCSICLVDFVNLDVLGKIECPHKFHYDCIKQWLTLKNFCPLCKEIAIQPPNQA